MRPRIKHTLVIVAAVAGTWVVALVAAAPVRQWWTARSVAKAPSGQSTPTGGAHAGHAPASVPSQDQHGAGEMAAANMVEISPEKLQSVGVTFEAAERRSLERAIRTVGRAEIDERRLARVNVK